MNMKKIVSFILSIVMALTVIVASPLTISVNAASTKLNAGDEFFAGIDLKTGKLNGKISYEAFELDDPVYRCVVKEDGTVTIEFFYWSPAEYYGAAAFLNPETLEPGKELIIPAKVNGYTVTEIANSQGGSFGNTGVKKIVIPKTVRKIQEEAFHNNFFLEEIVFDGKSQLKEIGYGAFLDCRSLKSITIPASVEKIEDWAFANTDMSIDAEFRRKDWHYVNGHLGGNFMTVSDIILDAIEITSVDDESKTIKYKINKPELIFDDVYSLTTVKFEKGSKLKHIGYGTFAFQKVLKNISLPDHLETLSCQAFGGHPANGSLVEFAESKGITIVDLPENDDNTSSEKTETKTDKKTDSKTDKKTDSKTAAKTYSINSAPVVKSATSKSAGTIELSWDDVGARSYIVYIAKSSIGNYTKCGIFTGTSATISAFGKSAKLESGTTYTIRVIRSDYKGELWEALQKYAPVSVTVK